MSNKVYFKYMLFKGSLFKNEVECYISKQKNISSKNVKQEIDINLLIVNFRTTNQYLSWTSGVVQKADANGV